MCITHAPRRVILEWMLPQTDALLAELGGFKETPSAYNGKFWDDWCLAMFLRGVCLRYVAYPVRCGWLHCNASARSVFVPSVQDADAVVDPEEKFGMTESAAERDAVAAFEGVFKEGDKIVLDHYLNYYARTSAQPTNAHNR